MGITETLSELVRIRSDFPNEEKIGTHLENTLREMGFQVRRQEIGKGRFNVIASRGNGPAFLLYGHMDTVQVCDGWTKDPFGAFVDNGKMYGLGAFDMKAGIASILEAVKGFDPQNITLKIAFAADEENISKGGYVIAQSGFLDGVRWCIVPEISSTENYEEGMFILGRRGRFAAAITVEGKSYHASIPERGINALSDAAAIIRSLDGLELAHHQMMGKSSVCPLSIEVKNKSLTVPDRAVIFIDRHLVPPETIDSAISDMKKLIDSLDIRSRVKIEPIKRETPFLMPYETSQENKFVGIVSAIGKEIYGRVSYDYGLSAADECILGNMGMPVVVASPIGANPHGADEWVDIGSVERLSQFIRAAIKKIDAISGNA
ncbi:MAG: M20/M25/M40 family metallo-hydrolase [Candidatus Micrarchaeota archaeon]|nr:M20/M25/M40 family metallo-hydrolase [Candidatus Micrarchaeota archaeon]